MRLILNRVAFVERFRAVLYPFPMEALLRVMPEQGWVVPLEDPESGQTRLATQASKGDVKLAFNTESRTFGTTGNAVDPVIDEYLTLRAYAVKEFGLSPEVESEFTEFRLIGQVNTGVPSTTNPAALIDSWWAGHPRSDSFAKFLAPRLEGEDVGVYGIRMASKGRDANRRNWSEITIAPSSTSGTRIFNVDLLYRNESLNKAELVGRRSEQTVLDSVSEMSKI